MIDTDIKKCFVDLLFHLSSDGSSNTRSRIIRSYYRRKWRHLEIIAKCEVSPKDAIAWIGDIERPANIFDSPDTDMIQRQTDCWESRSGRFIIRGPSLTPNGRFEVLDTENPDQVVSTDHYWEAFMVVEQAAVGGASLLDQAA